MRFTLLAVLASSTLLTSAAEIDRDTILPVLEVSAPIGKPECVYNAIRDSNLDCDVSAILECFEAEPNKEISDRIGECLSSSGCVTQESIERANTWTDACRLNADIEEEYLGKELKKRDDESSSTKSTDASTTKISSSASAASTTSDTSITSSSETSSSTASAAASTTVASSTTSSASSTTSGSTLSTSTTSATSATITSSSSNSCFAYSTVQTTACYVSSGSKVCTSTTSTASSCAGGMYCATDSAGADTCMVKIDKLTPSGTAVAIVFGTAVATFFITLLSCACKDSRAASRRKKAMEAALEADAKVASVAMTAGANRTKNPSSSIPLLPGQTQNLGGRGEDTRNLLGQSGPNPMSTGGSHNYTPNGSGPSSPRHSEENDYNEVRR